MASRLQPLGLTSTGIAADATGRVLGPKITSVQRRHLQENLYGTGSEALIPGAGITPRYDRFAMSGFRAETSTTPPGRLPREQSRTLCPRLIRHVLN
jgi:hypothetical protein